MRPNDVMELGRMAILQDPTGATFAIWQAKDHVGIRVAGEPGTRTWTELLTSNAQAARCLASSARRWNKI